MAALMELAIETAMRLGEMRRLTWADVNISERYVHLRDTKNGTERRVLAGKLANVLELAAVTGHKDLKMLGRYYNPHPSDLAAKLG